MSHVGIAGNLTSAVGVNLVLGSDFREMSYLQVPVFDFDLLNTSPPLLGSPYNCGVWSPLRNKSPLVSPISSSEESLLQDDYLIQSSNLQQIEGNGFYEILCSFRDLQYRMKGLLINVQKMRMDVHGLGRDFKKHEANVDRKLRELARTRSELADEIYLDNLISLLNGDLRHLPINKWPFRLSQSGKEPLDLVI